MPMRNKFRTFCTDCGRDVREGDGLSEKREVLNLPGDGWVTKHRQCSFTPARPATRAMAAPYRRHQPELTPIYDDWDEFNITGGMTESEFFGGSLGDNH